MNEFDLDELARRAVQKHNERAGNVDERGNPLLSYDEMTGSQKDNWREAVGEVARVVANQIRKAA